jgi:hypothetical protein
MLLLSGMFPPTSGFARVNGFSIETELSKVRESLGLCPQHDMLFSDLSPYEHFMIFSMVTISKSFSYSITETLIFELLLTSRLKVYLGVRPKKRLVDTLPYLIWNQRNMFNHPNFQVQKLSYLSFLDIVPFFMIYFYFTDL